MSPWERQLQYLFERAQDEHDHEEASFIRHLTISANGSVYTAVVPDVGTHIHLHGLSVLNSGNAAAIVRLYIAGDTAPSSVLVFTGVPAAVDQKLDVLNFGIKLPLNKGITIGSAGAQAGSLPEAIIYYHLESD